MCRSVELGHWFIQLRLIASSIPRCWAYILRMKVISITLFFPRVFTSSLLWGRVWILQPVEDLTFFGVPLLHTLTDSCACPWGCSRDGLLPPLGSHSSLLSSVLCLGWGRSSVLCVSSQEPTKKKFLIRANMGRPLLNGNCKRKTFVWNYLCPSVSLSSLEPLFFLVTEHCFLDASFTTLLTHVCEIHPKPKCT